MLDRCHLVPLLRQACRSKPSAIACHPRPARSVRAKRLLHPGSIAPGELKQSRALPKLQTSACSIELVREIGISPATNFAVSVGKSKSRKIRRAENPAAPHRAAESETHNGSVSLTRRFSKALAFTATYTYSADSGWWYHNGVSTLRGARDDRPVRPCVRPLRHQDVELRTEFDETG